MTGGIVFMIRSRGGKEMKTSSLTRAFTISAAAMLVAGCIAGNPSNRELESLSISPVTATAGGSAVQFTAAGYWSAAPTTETPMAASWGACTEVNSAPINLTSDVTVSAAGLATCGSG